MKTLMERLTEIKTVQKAVDDAHRMAPQIAAALEREATAIGEAVGKPISAQTRGTTVILRRQGTNEGIAIDHGVQDETLEFTYVVSGHQIDEQSVDRDTMLTIVLNFIHGSN